MQYIAKSKQFIKQASSKGFFDIVVSGTIAKAMSFVSVVVLSRLISKSDFGLMSYTDNIRSYVMLFGGLGLQNSVLRYTAMAKDADEKGRIFKTAFVAGCAINILIAVCALAFFSFFSLPLGGASGLMVSMCFLPALTFVFECSQLYLRADFFNRSFASLSIIYAASYMIFQMVPAYFWGLYGIVLGRYLSFAVVIAACVYYVPGLRQLGSRLFLDIKKFKEIFRYGMLAMLANCASLIISLNEILILGSILKSTDSIAEYRAAAIFPQILSFFSTAVITFVFPYFSKNHLNKRWLWSNYKKLIFLLTACLLPFILLIMAFPSLFLGIVYGSRYASSGTAGILRVLLIANAVNICVRIPTGNILAAVGDVKFNFINSFACSVLHIGAEIFLVTRLGLAGSPIALALVYTSSTAVAVCFFRHSCASVKRPAAAIRHSVSKGSRGSVKMKKVLFIAHVPIQQSESRKHMKFIYQMHALQKHGYEVDFIGSDGENYYLCSNSGEMNLGKVKNRGRYTNRGFFAAVKKSLGGPADYDYAYVASEPFVPQFLGMLGRLRRQDIRVILDLPTYPYDSKRHLEKGLVPYMRLLVDRFCRGLIKRYVDVIAAASDEETIFSIPVVSVENSVELELVKRRRPSFHANELHLLGLATMETWHGYDRIIEGLRAYYSTRQDFRVYLHLVGDGRMLTRWFRLALQYNLGSYVFFHGEKYGGELDEIFDACDLGVAPLGLYRLNLGRASGLNISEFCARGLPFIYACHEAGLDSGVCFAKRYPNTSEPIDIESVAAFYRSTLKMSGIGEKMFEFAIGNCTWQRQFDNIFDFFEKEASEVKKDEDT